MATSIQVVFDCADPDRMARFWAAALGYKLQDPPPGFATWEAFLEKQGYPRERRDSASAIVDPEGAKPRIFFQKVPEGKTVKNRVHLDLNVGRRTCHADGRTKAADRGRDRASDGIGRPAGPGGGRARRVLRQHVRR